MAIQINQIGPCFAGEVSGIDLTNPLSSEDAAAIHAGMDKYAVLVFHGQELTNEQQLAFTQALGPLEQAIGTSLRQSEDQRLPTTFADVSNLDKDNKPFAVDDRRRLFAIGNRLWHSDSSFKVIPAKYSLLHAHSIPSTGGNTEFADMRAAYDSLDQETKDIVEDLVCEHSQIYSRAKLGFTDFTPEELERFNGTKVALPGVSRWLDSRLAGARGTGVPNGPH
jgi:alpha-ketoglutarate-dependent 2,4-dichlorophenoxyacetate dioxygenase